jgi:hypothetical protein
MLIVHRITCEESPSRVNGLVRRNSRLILERPAAGSDGLCLDRA